MSLLTAEPVPQGGKGVDLLSLPSHPEKKHPLLVNKTLKLMACSVSSDFTKKKGIQRNSLSDCELMEAGNSYNNYIAKWKGFAFKNSIN